jgi:methionyl-tRNA formyltransferase
VPPAKRSDPQEPPIRILILTSETPGNVYLVNRLLAEHEVVGMVVESPRPALTQQEKRARRRSLFERHGAVRALNKLAYNWLRSRYLSRTEASIMTTEFSPGGAQPAYARSVPTEVVGNINDAACAAMIQRLGPDVIAVCGTSVIKPDIYSLAPLGTVNIHTGITPEYRSADPIFWALYANDPRKVGVTIHYVDKGIDTGPIIHQESVPLFATDSLASISVRCIRRGAELYLQTLRELQEGSVQTIRRNGVRDKAFYSIDLGIVQYLIFLWRFRRLRRGLPHPACSVSATQSGVHQ